MADAAHLHAVAEFGELALARPSVRELHDAAVREAANATGADIAFLMLLDDEGPRARLVAAVGGPVEYIGNHTSPADDASIIGRLLRHDRVALEIDDEFRRRYETPLLDQLGVVRVATALLRVDGRRAGLLGVGRTADRGFGPDELDVVRTLATLLSHAIERTRDRDLLSAAAVTDELTGLGNRALFLDRLRVALGRPRHEVAVVVADVDGFRDVNEALGHEAGDALLRSIGERLVAAVDGTATVARLGGDEFAVLLEDIADAQEAVDTAQLLADRVGGAPFELGGSAFHIAVGMGVAVRQRAGASADRLLRNASVAMERAKVSGRGKVEVFGEQLRAGLADRLHLTSDLVAALAGDELVVHYQPEVSLQGSEVWCEALIRWPHRERGFLSPADFVGLAEDTGLVVPMGRFVLERAAEQLARWRDLAPGSAPTAVSVNLSARQLIEGDLVGLTVDLLDRHGFPPDALWFELTETAVVGEPVRSEATLRALKDIGVGLALDDFGTGYSSLTHVRTLPIDALKIDREFVGAAGPGLADERIVEAALHLARSFSLLAIAEGVETIEQLARLRVLGCDFAQGYALARPGDPESVEAFTRAHLAPRREAPGAGSD